MTTPMSSLPLSRNRDFRRLQAGRLLSGAGSEATVIAYPLLVLAVTNSPARAGIAAFARLLPSAAFALLAGVAADRWNRKRLLIGADVVRGVAVAALGAAIVLDRLAFWQIVVVAFVEGTGSAVFSPAAAGALRAVVPTAQLPAAAGVQEARSAVVMLLGPPVGGLLFGLGRAVPFLVDACSYLCSIASLASIRTPFQDVRPVDPAPLRTRIADGFRFLWSHPFLRTCALLWGLGNFALPGLLLTIVVLGRRDGLSGGQIGALMATFGGCILIGSLLSPFARRRLSARAILLLELWAWLGCGGFLVWPSVSVLVAGILPMALVIPISDSVVTGYRIAVTPDRLVGRVEGVRTTISLLLAPFGPLAAGVLLSSGSARLTVAVFAVFALALAVWGTLSPAIRNAPSLSDLSPTSDLTASSRRLLSGSDPENGRSGV
jgi:predicted MFS family arabinose efflux permease